ncbi:cGMP-dependent protein kinase 1-like, partial [Asbolus verrucosus]
MIKNLFRRSDSCNTEQLEKRRPAITPQHFEYDDDVIKTITKHPKSKEDEMFIRSALENNDFLNSLLQNKKLQNVIDCMYPESVIPNQTIIKEGDNDGSHLYVSITGTYEVIQNNQVINTFSDVRVFGELALLYNARRMATIKSKSFGRLWILDRVVFKHLMVHSDIEHHKEMVSFLEQVPKLNTVPKEVLEEVAKLLKLEFFTTGTKIVEEGVKKPDKFYIIRAGSVTISKNTEGAIDKLYRGNFFGELALLKENERKATVTADAPGTECLILTRQEFIAHFGNIPDCFSINIQTQPYKPMEEIIEHTDLRLDDFKIVSTLGIGGFGRVELVQHSTKRELVFALKYMQKYVIAAQKQQEHVFNEKNVQIACKNNFVVRLYRTYKDRKYLYFLLEPCLGGDLWNHLHKQKPRRFDEDQAKFYAGCVVEAFEYLHERRIIYRDLKPENLLIDSKGYIKLTDFGFAKKLDGVKKTYTFAGTPEYVPPEIILNQGHDKGVDYWALGVFIFELLTGKTPFRSDDTTHMRTYKLILKGIDDVVFPQQVTYEAQNLVKQLCKSTSTQRLGCQNCGIMDIKVNAWFRGFDWDKLAEDYFFNFSITSRDDKLIREAIEKNDFLNKLFKGNLLKEVVDAMYNREIKNKEVIIKEGETGSHMYVSAQGRYEVSVKGKGIVNTFEDVRVFGELAILYNAKRNATIKAVKSGRVWVLDRTVYQKMMVRFNIKEQDEMLEFLQKVPKLNKVGTQILKRVTGLLKMEYFTPGTKIVKEGDRGDKFYIIRAGTVTITKEGEGVVAHFAKGQYFGELALLKEDFRQATVTADTPGVECLTLLRQHFIDHFGELREDGFLSVPQTDAPKVSASVKVKEHQDVHLNDLKIITTLGVGGFGRVELVQHKTRNVIFALKYLKKIDMVEQNQQEHVYNERNIQMDCRSKFIVRLYRSYKDAKYIYFLMESCLGGDLWTLLQRQKNRRFDEKDSRFIAACVLEAFTYLHERGIVYRDLKPENLLIDEHGYIKLTDFGFAKNLGDRGRTFTFAGTPEYVAPEIILSRGHDKAVDYWAFGIFIFELLTGRTPFRTNDASHMRTYNKILTGIDNVEFPSYIPTRARHIIEKLCRPIPTERLGCQRSGVKDIKNHRWFLGFDWARLNEGKLPSSFKPKLKSNIDTRYFETFKKDNDIPPDEES